MATKSADKDKDKEATKPAFEYTDEMIQKAADLIVKQGYATRKDIPEMKDLDWAYGLGEKVDKYFNDKNAGRFIYHEDFDYAGGDIAALFSTWIRSRPVLMRLRSWVKYWVKRLSMVIWTKSNTTLQINLWSLAEW